MGNSYESDIFINDNDDNNHHHLHRHIHKPSIPSGTVTPSNTIPNNTGGGYKNYESYCK